MVCDAFDGSEWMESTVQQTQMRHVTPNRSIPMCYVGFRVYRNKGKKLHKDEKGVYDGYSAKYDEWIPLHSPMLAPHLSKSQGYSNERVDMDEELDNVIQPQFGFEKVFGVPRIYSCMSKKFIYFMDMFGNAGGFDTLLEVMENEELEDKKLTLTQIGYMITLLSMPAKLWHTKFVEAYGPRFCTAIERRLLESDDVKLRDLEQ